LILMFAWCTSSLDTGKTMHMFTMALASLIVQNSVLRGELQIGSSLVAFGWGGCEYFGCGLTRVMRGLRSDEVVG
jgi:hypothetical protein